MGGRETAFLGLSVASATSLVYFLFKRKGKKNLLLENTSLKSEASEASGASERKVIIKGRREQVQLEKELPEEETDESEYESSDTEFEYFESQMDESTESTDPLISSSVFRVPMYSYGTVCGRRGAKLKRMERKSHTTIRVSNDNVPLDFIFFTITGESANCKFAQCLFIEGLKSSRPIITGEVWIPMSVRKSIIGINGEKIKWLREKFVVQIDVQNFEHPNDPRLRKISLIGPGDEVESVIKLLGIEIEREKDFLRRRRNNALNELEEEPEEEDLPLIRIPQEKFFSTGNNVFLLVCVSAIESPDRMWVQIMGPSFGKLGQLNEEMTRYYSNKRKQRYHMLKNAKPGQLVAAQFRCGKTFYRGKVLKVLDMFDFKDPEVYLHYVDYGDTGMVKMSQIFQLRGDFMNLRSQAIECTHGKIKPKDSKWSEEAVNFLADLTHVGQWRSLIAKVPCYKMRPTTDKADEGQEDKIPCIELYDDHGRECVNMAEEMVRKGFAVWEEETTEDSDEVTNKVLDEETLKKSSETDKKRKESDESS